MKFRKKPVVIEAWNWDGTQAMRDTFGTIGLTSWSYDGFGALIIHTLEGNMRAEIGDWIIKGVVGEFYPCKPDIFEQTYEPVDDAHP